ncbi:hypothetical protein [uncultured Pseudoteredinibacter sp.]|uniref:hypothetical protein n=1 Tax=uncultured Pseudoteredinibacter sp. TaxID=1641701 RepID=UPI002629D828|nr:hypothetical protein [uncultured Pseudoteredinibacter sp.]
MKTWQTIGISLGAAIATTANAYEVSGSRWENGQFKMYVGVAATVPSLDFDDNPITWNSIVQEALGAWNNPVQGLNIEIVDETRDPCEGYTGVNTEIANSPVATNEDAPTRNDTAPFENGIGLSADVCGEVFGSGVYAVTLLQTRPSQPGFYREADIVFNQAYQYDRHNNGFGSGSEPGTAGNPLDVRRIAIKQIGYALGLRDESNQPSIMHPNAATRTITSPTSDDLAGMRILYPNPVSSNDPDVRLSIEEPNSSQVKSGISNIRGWAIGLKDIRLVEVSIDNGSYQSIPYGGVRTDVASAFSQYPKSGNSGYSMLFNWGLLSPGQHQIRVRAHDIDDNVATITRNVTVASFNDSYVSAVNIGGSSSISNQKTVTLNNVNADNQNYTVKLEWDNAAQKFNIVSTQAN